MEKKSRRKVGARRYADYSEETLKVAVDLVKSKSLSSYEAEKQFGIPRRTILNYCKYKHEKAYGRPNKLTVEDENHIADVLEMAGKFGCPLSMLDLRIVVHNYIQKTGRNQLFNGKMPGERWARNFLELHKFTLRATQNIKRNRAAKTVDELSTYFEHLATSIKDIPSKNILNFDETNLCDDPGSSKAAFKRGIKHPERVLNSTKTSISIMFSVTADGECLPPYVVYKAEHLWSQWCKNGPPNARYNRTKSGWFDMVCFDDWFKTIILPWAKSREGPKVIIGDNLSSHLSVEVIQLCKENNINLVFLPPNSTHLTQPLDVAFFGPMKKSWRKILLDYKVANSNVTTLNKTHFPELLRELMKNINLTSSSTICSGFAACGIFPHDPLRVLRKIPAVTIEEAKQFDVSLIEFLEKNRKTQTQTKKTNNKKLTTVIAGKSVSTEDVSQFIKGKDKSTIRRKLNTKISKKYTQISQQPSSLKVLCTDFVNKLLFKKDNYKPIKSRKFTAKKKLQKSVRLLGHVFQHDEENTPFTAAHDRDLPICLQTTDTNNSDNCGLTLKSAPEAKITILRDVKVTPGPSGIKGSTRSKAPKNQYTQCIDIKPEISINLEALNTKIRMRSIKSAKHDKKEIKNENKKINSALKHGTRRVLRYSRSSTSISDEISLHSDSSIMDISDEVDSDNSPLSRFTNLSLTNVGTIEPPTLKNRDKQFTDKVLYEVYSEKLILPGPDDPRQPSTHNSTNIPDIPNLNESDDLGNILTDTNCPALNCTKRSHYGSHISVKTRSLSILEETNNKISQCESTFTEQKESQLDSLIQTNDTVLVMYYSRNTWKYYIGVVTTSNNDGTFDVSFYTTMRTKSELIFKKPRRLDRDTVPRDMIVKVIELTKISDKPQVFHLHNQNDAIYF